MMRWVLIAAAFACAGEESIARWERYEKLVRDQEAPKDSLRAEYPGVMAGLQARYGAPEAMRATTAAGTPATVRPDPSWVFPLKGYGRTSVGKGGFRPDIRYGGSPIKGYDFFDGNRHGGHPAYDIFIRDRDQDSREDGTGRPVEVLAPVDLIVVSRETAWDSASGLRGGKYLWAFAPRQGMLIYFSHLDTVLAAPGDSVPAGRALAWVGRTGKNAAAKRSPTHLHLMALRLEAGMPRPFDYFKRLRK